MRRRCVPSIGRSSACYPVPRRKGRVADATFFFFQIHYEISGVWVPVEIVGEGEHFPALRSKAGEAQPVCVADRPHIHGQEAGKDAGLAPLDFLAASAAAGQLGRLRLMP
jgi:hypothetical protein